VERLFGVNLIIVICLSSAGAVAAPLAECVTARKIQMDIEVSESLVEIDQSNLVDAQEQISELTKKCQFGHRISCKEAESLKAEMARLESKLERQKLSVVRKEERLNAYSGPCGLKTMDAKRSIASKR
jgi:hypothetical protein